MPTLGEVWFLLVGVLILGYAVLDGFDLGVGIVAPFVAPEPAERRLAVRAIGPVWDGNEVWLLTAGGALFAAFPLVYATIFSGFYLALILLVLALILRATALEFRGQVDDRRWRLAWDVALFAGSLLAPLLLGVAVGNVIRGLPLDAEGLYRGGLIGLLTPFPLVVGALAVAFAITHGSLWLRLRTEPPIADRAARCARIGWLAQLVLWLAATALAPSQASGHWAAFGSPAAWLAPLLVAVGLVGLPLALRASRDLLAFGASMLVMIGFVATLGVGLYPNLVPALDAPERSLTIGRAASSDLTLGLMLAIAAVAVPLVLVYTGFVYRRLWGKVGQEAGPYDH